MAWQAHACDPSPSRAVSARPDAGAAAQAEHWIEDNPGRTRQRTAQGIRKFDSVAAAQKFCAVGFGLQLAGSTHQEMRRPHLRVFGRALTPLSQQNVVGSSLGFHEHLGEGGVGSIGRVLG